MFENLQIEKGVGKYQDDIQFSMILANLRFSRVYASQEDATPKVWMPQEGLTMQICGHCTKNLSETLSCLAIINHDLNR